MFLKIIINNDIKKYLLKFLIQLLCLKMRCGDESIENEIEQKISVILNEAKNMKNSNEQKNVSLNVFS